MNTPPRSTPDIKLDWEVEKLKNEVRNLSRTFTVAIVTAILGVSATAYQIYDKISGLTYQQYEKKRLEDEIADLNRKKQKLGAERDTLNSQFHSFKAELSAVVSDDSLTPSQKLEKIPTLSPSFQFYAPDTTASTFLPARVYVQYLTSQKKQVDDIIAKFKSANYRITAIGNTTSKRMRIVSVSFYHESDKEEAQKLISFLKTIGIKNVISEPIKLNGSARNRHFDVWIAFPDN